MNDCFTNLRVQSCFWRILLQYLWNSFVQFKRISLALSLLFSSLLRRGIHGTYMLSDDTNSSIFDVI